MSKFLYIIISIGIFIFWIWIWYYYIIALPSYNQQKLDFEKEKEKNNNERLKKEQIIKENNYNNCIKIAYENYYLNWNNACYVYKIETDNKDQKDASDCKKYELILWENNIHCHKSTYILDSNGRCSLPAKIANWINKIFNDDKISCKIN